MNWVLKTIICFVVIFELVYSYPHFSNQFNSKTKYLSHKTIKNHLSLNVQQNSSAISKPNNVQLTFCSVCVDFADAGLNELLNAVLNVGIVGGCSELCSYVQNRTDKAIGVVCNLLCDYVGIKEFVKIIEEADLDSIYYCELLDACPVNDNADASIASFTITPNQGPQGVFIADLVYVTVNGTGTGQYYIDIKTVDGIPAASEFLLEAQKPGKYEEQIQISAQPDPECDPTQGPCEEWLPGTYEVEMAICNGECGSKHPHSKVLAFAKSNFTIV